MCEVALSGNAPQTANFWILVLVLVLDFVFCFLVLAFPVYSSARSFSMPFADIPHERYLGMW